MLRVLVQMKIVFVCIALAGCSGNTGFGLPGQDVSFGQQVTYNNKVDVLFVVDSTPSMAKHQTAIADQVGSFIDILDQKGIDYRLAVTTMDMSGGGARGAFHGTNKVLSPSTPNLKSAFRQNVSVGETGSEIERGIDTLRAAITPPLSTGANAGFLRSDAVLAIVFVTNEDDKSAGSTAEVIAALDAIKPQFPYGARGWIANVIGLLDVGTSCTTSASYTEPADRYLALASESGGASASICSNNMAEALSSIRQRISQMISDYRLGREPIESTIQVWVQGVPLAKDNVNGWSYIANGFIIRFNGNSVPPAGSDVRIAFQPRSSK